MTATRLKIYTVTLRVGQEVHECKHSGTSAREIRRAFERDIRSSGSDAEVLSIRYGCHVYGRQS